MSLILFFLNHSLLGKIKINIRTVVFKIFLYIIDLYLIKKGRDLERNNKNG